MSIGLIMGTKDNRNCPKVNLYLHVMAELKQQLSFRQFTNPQYQWIQ
jgi:hypothetical protein